MPDQTILCTDCRTAFIFSEKEQAFFREKGFQPPKRCRACRELKRQEKERSGGR